MFPQKINKLISKQNPWAREMVQEVGAQVFFI